MQKWITVTIHLLHHWYKAKARMGQGQRKYATDKALTHTHTHWILDFDPFSRKLVQGHCTPSMLIGTLLVKLGFMFWKRRISNLDPSPLPSPMFLTLGLCYASIANKTRSEEIVNQMHTVFFLICQNIMIMQCQSRSTTIPA